MRKFLFALAASALLLPSVAFAEVLTSVDWLLMKPAERVAAVTDLLKDFRAKGLPFQGEAYDYVPRIDEVVADPRLPSPTPLDRILLTIGYTNEPPVRAVIDAHEARKSGKKENAS